MINLSYDEVVELDLWAGIPYWYNTQLDFADLLVPKNTTIIVDEKTADFLCLGKKYAWYYEPYIRSKLDKYNNIIRINK